MRFKSTPIALRIQVSEFDGPSDEKLKKEKGYQDSTPATKTYSASGILIADYESNTHHVLTISPILSSVYKDLIPRNSPKIGHATTNKNVSVLATVRSAFSTRGIDWYSLKMEKLVPLDAVNDTLHPFLEKQLYVLKPKDINNASSHVYLSVLKLDFLDDEKDILKELEQEAWREFHGDEDLDFTNSSGADRREVQIESSPFVLVNPVVFTGHVSRASLVYVAPNPKANPYVKDSGNQIGMLLSDVRFLDGMEGGAVFENDKCVGLVAGKLTKRSGEGELTVIAPWKIIRQGLQDTGIVNLPSENKIQHSKKSGIDVLDWIRFNGVVLIEVEHGNGQMSWGSGIVLDLNQFNDDPESLVIVSNKHVLGNSHKRVFVWYSSKQRAPDTVHVKGMPLDGIDLAVFTCPSSLTPAKLYSQDLKPKQSVYSMGYGIIYPKTGRLTPILQPLVSKGHIASVVPMKLFEQFDNSGTDAPKQALAVCTSGCWNGSSGGAVLDSKTGQVVSMMTSNGRVTETGEVIPELSFTLPSSVIQLALKLVSKNETIKVSKNVVDLWKLRETHVSYERIKTKPRL